MMTGKRISFLTLMAIGAAGLAGCEAPQGGHYNNAVYDGPNYDSIGYTPKYTPEFYNSSYYYGDSFEMRPNF
jgi:hypothetical protein